VVQVRVSVSKDFLEIVGKNVLSARPAWRVNASAIDTNANSALLISHHSLFSGKVFESEPCYYSASHLL
jgi:inositol-pentakisphosphate 2-kinase